MIPSPHEFSTKTRWLSILLSLLIHAGLLFWLFSTKYRIHTDLFGREVRNVFIAPEEGLVFPGTEMPDKKEVDTEAGPSRPLPAASSRGVTAIPEKDDPVPFRKGGETAISPSVLVEAEKFALDVPEKFASGTVGETAFHMIMPWEKPAFQRDRYLQKSRRGSLDLSDLWLPPEQRGSKTLQHMRGRRSILDAVKGVDISPWAGQVLEKIQNNWRPAAPEKIEPDRPVKVAVTVLKSGMLERIQLLESSSDPALDDSVLSAIRISLPFPELPESLSDKTLTVVLVFSIDE